MAKEKNITVSNGELDANCDQFITVENRILTIRGVQVILDRDLADLYGVETKVLNQSVKRNIERFPEHFRFQLSKYEMDELVTNCDRFKNLKHSTVCSFAFTEQGVAMLASVLRSETAIRVSIRIMDAFVSMRHFLINRSIVLIDNYVDETVLTLLDKRVIGVTADIYTQQINQQLHLDINRHNSQYPPINVSVFRRSHDRFLCIDDVVYHIGASIKDLGKKWFAFAKMEVLTPTELVAKINE